MSNPGLQPPTTSVLRSKIEQLTRHPINMLSLHVTDRCNSKCQFCVVNSPVEQTPISTDTLLQQLEGYADNVPDVLNLHGGEPTLSDALGPILETAQRLGVREVHLQTNGISLANRDYVDRLMAAGVSVFVVSLHGHTAAQQEQITLTPNSFEKILRGIQHCSEAGALVRTNTVICKQNIETLYEVLALSCDLGVEWQNISALHPSKHAMDSFHDLVVHPKDVRNCLPPTIGRLRETFPTTTVELEGFPVCHAPGLEKYHIDTTLRHIRMIYHDKVFDDYEAYMNSTQRHCTSSCFTCGEVINCKGIYHAYESEFDGPIVWPQ